MYKDNKHVIHGLSTLKKVCFVTMISVFSFHSVHGNAEWRAKKVKKREEAQFAHTVEHKVSREIRRQKFDNRRNNIKDIVYPPRDMYKRLNQEPVFVYKLPHVPFASTFYELRDLFQVQLNLSTASRSFSSRGKSKDITEFVFPKMTINCDDPCNNILISDILLASKLAKADKLGDGRCPSGSVNAHPDKTDLALLADQKIVFNGSTTSVGASINFARHFHRGDISFGCQIPIVYRENCLEICNKLDPAIAQKLGFVPVLALTGRPTTDPLVDNRSKSRFVGKSLNEIVCEILDAKGTKLDKSRSEVGIGDISTFLHYEIKSCHFERLLIGVQADFPTSCELDNHTLWDPRLGNSYFTRLGVFATAMWGAYRAFNPYVHVSGTYAFPAHMQRRVPQKIEFDGNLTTGVRVSNQIPDDLLLFGENVVLVEGQDFCEFDSLIRHFSNDCYSFKIHPGPEFFLRVGNMFERVFCDRLFLDVYYDIRLKGRDYLGSRKVCDSFDPSIWTKKSYETAHRFGGAFSYQFGHQVRLAAGASYIFEGHNVAKAFEAHFDFNIEF